MRLQPPLILTLLVLIVLSPTQGQSSPAPQPLFTGLNWPVAIAFAPDGRIFFNEKNTGRIRIIEEGSLRESPFATLSVMAQGEAGLLGLALDPNFESNHYLYAYFSYRNPSGDAHVAIRRFTAQANIGTDPIDIFDLTNPTGNPYHNGGYIKFGPDGKLYVQVGEFQNSALAQNLKSYAGKILRLNSDGSVPSDNPFANSLVYAYGIRNGFGMDFEPNTGRLVATEAGTDRDEINVITAGGNYGWPDCLGVCNDPRYMDPILTIGPPAATPTGIVQAGVNNVFFGEWSAADIKMMQLSPGTTAEQVEQVFSLGGAGGGVIAVERGFDGNIYFSTTDAIYKFPTQQQSTLSGLTSSISTSLQSITGPDGNTSVNVGATLVSIGVTLSAVVIFLLLRSRLPKKPGSASAAGNA